jgi:hypothetical protein
VGGDEMVKPRLIEVGLLIASVIVGFLLCEALFRAYLFYADYRAEGDRVLTVYDIGTDEYNWLVERGFINESESIFIPSNNPDIRYVLNPNISKPRRGFSIKINSDGFKDNEYSWVKGSNVFRIMILGDSVAVGFRLNASDRYSEYLEEMLNSNPRTKTKYEVINAAVWGYDTRQEVGLLRRKGLKYNPDLVILAYYLNDPAIYTEGMNYFQIMKYCNKQYIPIESGKAGRRIRLYRKYGWMINKSELLTYLLREYALEDEILKTYENVFTDKRTFEKALKWDVNWFRKFVCLHYNDRFWNPVRDEFKKLGNLSNNHDFKVILLINPKVERKDVLWENYPLTPIHMKVMKEAESNNFYTHDLLDDFKKFPVNLISLELKDPHHYSALGHRVAAVSLYNYLIENKLIPEYHKFNKKPITDALNITLMKTT